MSFRRPRNPLIFSNVTWSRNLNPRIKFRPSNNIPIPSAAFNKEAKI